MPASVSASETCITSTLLSVQRHIEQSVHRAGKPLQPVCAHLLNPGQRIRARFLLTTCGDLSNQSRQLRAVQAASAVELLHAATLIQDDIFDEAHLRRGRIATHLAFGRNLATLASDWLLMEAVRISMEVHPNFACLLLRATQEMAIAEAQELSPPPQLTLAEAQHHIRYVALGKTGALFGAALAGAATLQEADTMTVEALWTLGKELGLTFQILDDCKDVYSSLACTGKDVRHDLKTGRLTFPMLAAVKDLDPTLSSSLLPQILRSTLTCTHRRLLRLVLSTDRLQQQMDQLLAGRYREHALQFEALHIPSELHTILSELRTAAY